MARRRKVRRARRKSTAVARYAAPRRRRRARSLFRRNPGGFSLKGIGEQAMQGVIDAGELTLGKIGSRLVRGKLGFPGGTTTGMIVEFVTALGGGLVTSKWDRNFGKMFTAGGISGPIESVVKTLNIPFVSAPLGDEGDLIEIGLAGVYDDDGLGGVYAPDQLPAGVPSYASLGEEEMIEA